jgi:hypothetical protein
MAADTPERAPLLVALTCTLAEMRAIERGLDRERQHWYPNTKEGRLVHDLHARVQSEMIEAQLGTLFRLRQAEGSDR